MNQSDGKSERVEQLIQYAMDIFDLVEIVPGASVGRSIGRRFRQPEMSPATRYGEMGVKRPESKRALALNSRVC